MLEGGDKFAGLEEVTSVDAVMQLSRDNPRQRRHVLICKKQSHLPGLQPAKGLCDRVKTALPIRHAEVSVRFLTAEKHLAEALGYDASHVDDREVLAMHPLLGCDVFGKLRKGGSIRRLGQIFEAALAFVEEHVFSKRVEPHVSFLSGKFSGAGRGRSAGREKEVVRVKFAQNEIRK